VRSARLVISSRWGSPRAALSDVPRGLAVRAIASWRRHRLETTAVILMTLCALIYPQPVWLAGFALWLAGAVCTAASKLWSPGDKWAAIFGPVFLVIGGAATALALGGVRHSAHAYLHEVLVNSVYMIKIGSLLGAAFLAWRLQRGRRDPVPPWHRRRHA